MRRLALATTMLFALGAGAQAADVIKLGNLTQLSGPLAAPGSGRLLGVAAQQPEFDVVQVLAERLVERPLVRRVARL